MAKNDLDFLNVVKNQGDVLFRQLENLLPENLRQVVVLTEGQIPQKVFEGSLRK